MIYKVPSKSNRSMILSMYFGKVLVHQLFIKNTDWGVPVANSYLLGSRDREFSSRLYDF